MYNATTKTVHVMNLKETCPGMTTVLVSNSDDGDDDDNDGDDNGNNNDNYDDRL
jgi:hypothetical protein